MKRFIMYRKNTPSETHNSDQTNSPDIPQFEGVIFSDSKVAVRWLTAKRSVSIWDCFEDLIAIHGHPEYGSVIVWLDGERQ